MPNRLLPLLLAFSLAAFAQSGTAPSLPLTYFLGRDGNPARVGPDAPMISAKAVAVGPGGDIWVAGEAVGNTLPVVNAFRAENPPGPGCSRFRGCPDVFLSRLRADGQGARFSTYLGGSDRDTLAGMVLDEQGNAYLTGQTDSASFPFDRELRDEPQFGRPNFVAKISPAGELVYAAALPRATIPAAIAVDRQGSVYVGGLV